MSSSSNKNRALVQSYTGYIQLGDPKAQSVTYHLGEYSEYSLPLQINVRVHMHISPMYCYDL